VSLGTLKDYSLTYITYTPATHVPYSPIKMKSHSYGHSSNRKKAQFSRSQVQAESFDRTRAQILSHNLISIPEDAAADFQDGLELPFYWSGQGHNRRVITSLRRPKKCIFKIPKIPKVPSTWIFFMVCISLVVSSLVVAHLVWRA
jgi:hypothetical protein